VAALDGIRIQNPVRLAAVGNAPAATGDRRVRVGPPVVVFRFKTEDPTNHTMIAIACAKGGCGKTTTTLGLAAAVARAGTTSLAIDADRQLPDLHLTADVARDPTVAALNERVDWRSVAKQLPGSQDAYVLPGAKDGETFDLQSCLERLETDAAEVFVDCPSGSGPDVIEPLAAVDGVVIVTTKTDRSVEAARKTVDVAIQLNVDVAGAVVTMCDAPAETVELDLNVPVIGTVPESEQPLSDPRTTEAYDTIVRRLADGRSEPSTTPEPSAVSGPASASTPPRDALAEIDDRLRDLSAGHLVALQAAPESQSEQVLFRTTAMRGTLYLTTRRSEVLVKRSLEETPTETGSPTVRRVGSEDSISEALDLVKQLPSSSNLVVDTMNVFEAADPEAYTEFLNEVHSHVAKTDSLAVLHCLDPASDPENRRITNHFADAVFSFETAGDGVTLENSVTLSKHRERGQSESETTSQRAATSPQAQPEP